MTVLPTQYFLSSSNAKFGCCKICSSSQVASSLGKSFHCTKYSLIVLLLKFISPFFTIIFGMRISSLHHPREVMFLNMKNSSLSFSLYMRYEIHYGFYFLLEVPLDMPLLQLFEPLCRDHKTLVWYFMNLFILRRLVCTDETSNKPSHSLGIVSPLYVDLHIVLFLFWATCKLSFKTLKFSWLHSIQSLAFGALLSQKMWSIKVDAS